MATSSPVRALRTLRAALLAAAMLLLLFSARSNAQLSGNFTIGSGGTYATLSAAAAALNSSGVSGPVVFDIKTGTYNEQFAIKAIAGSSATNTVTFQSQTGVAANVTIAFSPTSGAHYVVDIDSSAYVTFQNITVSAQGTSGYANAFLVEGTANHITIRNCVLNGVTTTSNSSSLAVISSPAQFVDYLTITGNTFTSGGCSIYFTSNSSVDRLGTVITNNVMNNPGSTAIYLQNHESPLITGNTMTNVNGTGIELDNSAKNIKILKNKISVTGYGNGITFYQTIGGSALPDTAGLIADNFISVAYPSSVSGIDLTYCDHLNFYYNSVNMTGVITSSAGFYLLGGTAGTINLKNNIFANPGGGFATMINTPATVAASDYNDFFTTGNYLAEWNNVPQVDLPALRTASSMETNSIAWIPGYLSATDLHTGSPWLNNRGTPVAEVTDDIDGNVRSGSTPDIGASEYTPNPAVTTPLAGTYTIGAGGSYGTFAAAVSDLMTKGVSAPVTFDVLNGTYNESFVLYNVPGSNSSNSIMFQAQNGASNATLYALPGTSDSNYVVRLIGAKNLRFHRMTIRSNGTAGATYGRIFDLVGGVDSLTIDSTIMVGTPNASTSLNHQLINAPGKNSTRLVITGNSFTNGSYGVRILGLSSTAPCTNTLVNGNTFTNVFAPVFLQYHDSPIVSGNTATGNGGNGIDIENSTDFIQVVKNRLSSTGYGAGIYITSCIGGTGFPVDSGLIANNFVTSSYPGSATGIYFNYSSNVNVYYNSVNMTGASAQSEAFYLNGGTSISVNVKNNIFANPGGGLAYWINTPTAIGTTDYNDFYSTGNYLAAWGSTSAVDLPGIQSASSQEAHSLAYIPNFTSAANLHTNSPWLDNKGTPLTAVTDDIDGNARSASAPDIGASEYTSTVAAALAGTYTIGAGGNYASFNAAVADLLLRGISAPVTFNAMNGNYNEHIVLYSVPGSSSSNTITFEALNGVSSATLYYIAAAPESNYVVRMTGAEHVRFHRLTIRSSGTAGASYGKVFDLVGGVDDITIDSTAILGTPNASTSANLPLIYAPGMNYRSLTVNANTFTNGSYGVWISSLNSSTYCTNTQITGNTFNSVNSPVYLAYHDSPVISGNTVNNGNGNGIDVEYSKDAIQILKNRVNTTGYGTGIYLVYSVGGSSFPNNPGVVANNFVTSSYAGSVSGISSYGSSFINIEYNSVNLTGAATTSAGFYLYQGNGNNVNIENNIFANPGGGFAIDVATPAGLGTHDYNDYFTTGNYVAQWNNVNQIDLPAVRAAGGQDAHSVSVIPNFPSPTNLHTGSPWLDGKGTPLEDVSDDIDGNSRDGTTPDIGASEYSSDPAVRTPLAGAYTIGSGGTYPTFGAAIADLSLKGVSAPVTFNVLNGSYNEHLVIYNVAGSGITNSVTFQGTGASGATLYYYANSADSNYVVRLIGASHLKFRKLTIRSNNTSGGANGKIFDLVGGVDYLTVDSTVLAGTPNSGGSSTNYIINVPTTVMFRSWIFSNNVFMDGSYAIEAPGQSAQAPDSGLQIINNQFRNQGYISIWVQYQYAPVITGNSISNTGVTAISVNYCTDGIEITKNKISGTSATNGMYLYSVTGGNGFVSPVGLIANNFIQMGSPASSAGIALYYCANLNVEFNSVNVTSTSTTSAGFYVNGGTAGTVNVFDNIFANPGGGYASYVYTPATIDTVDYNDVVSSGTNLAYWNGAQTTMAAYKAACGQEAHSVSVDPGFFSASNLHTLSPALDSAGTARPEVTDDIDGISRNPVRPDIGASEYALVVSFSQSLGGPWNMISVPLSVPDPRKVVLYPTAVSPAFAYGPGGYLLKDTLVAGTGYWLKFPAPVVAAYSGEPLVRDSVHVTSGWNLIGAIGYPISRLGVAQSPPSIVLSYYFAYYPGIGYVAADTLQPGVGYWVKTSANGILTLDVKSTSAPPAISPKSPAQLDLSTLNELELAAAGAAPGKAAHLYFACRSSEGMDLSRYALPPAPPEGAFDVRFSSGGFVELAPPAGAADRELPLSLQGDGTPVKLTWTMRTTNGERYVLVERKGNAVTAERPLEGSGSMVLDDGKEYSVVAKYVPMEYSLMQNYPNPFNPTTSIRFGMPEAATVTLRIFNILGQEIAAPLVGQRLDKGMHTIEVDARTWVSGVYFYRLTAENPSTGSGQGFTAVKKMMLMK